MVISTYWPERTTIVLTRAQVEEPIARWRLQLRREPSQEQIQHIVNLLIEEHILYSRALEQGYHRLNVVQTRLQQLAQQLLSEQQPSVEEVLADVGDDLLATDSTIKRFLVQSMRELIRGQQQLPVWQDAQLRDHYQQNIDEYMTSARQQISHIFIKDSAAALAQITALRKRLHDQPLSVKEAIAQGDIFYGGHQLPPKTQQQLTASFGKPFADKVWELPLATMPQQEQDMQKGLWSEPVQSAFGWHLVWVENKIAAKPKSFESVQGHIVDTLKRQFLDKAEVATIAEIAKGYQVILPQPYQSAYRAMDSVQESAK